MDIPENRSVNERGPFVEELANELVGRNEVIVTSDLNGGNNRGVAEDSWPLFGLERVKSCPICASDQRKLIYQNLRDRVFYTAPGSWLLFRCQACHTIYLDPRPTESTIDLAYREYFTHAPVSDTNRNDVEGYFRLRRALANGYRNRRFGLTLQPSSPAGTLAAQLIPGMKRILEGEMRHLPRPKPGSRLLDVGCGNGEFLVLAELMGWTAEGLDPDARAVECCLQRGLKVSRGSIHDVDGDAVFDGITMSHVIEHVHDPLDVLKACYRLLKPGGWLWIETPNANSLSHRKFKQHWLGLDPPRHLVVFARKSLINLVGQAGFLRWEDMPHRPLFHESAVLSRAIRSGMGMLYEARRSRAERWILSLSEWRAFLDPNIREMITIRSYK